ncbi:IclR family transcriptional regulator [Actinomadura sp. WMMB 499]|uniref:IclR family transcriptional regulator n=1 Tax=Actinomadura sp. WMMB 499 TaxID=1219491 RepID=UPI00159E0E10|nr:IclR family transcriptional regulator [Actinomadura sp. WMMB 499]
MQTVEPSGPRPQYPIEAVDKALQMLKLFGIHEQVRLADVRDALEVTQSRAHRLMAMLVYHGFAAQDRRTRTYHPGPALVELGLSVIRGMDLRSVARPVLEELSAELGETTALAVLEGSDVRFIDAVESELALRVASRVGRLLPAHSTSIGKALLAELPAQTFRALYPSEQLPPVTAKTITRRSQLEEHLQSVRERGYAVNASESEEGVSSVARVIRDRTRGVVGAVSVAAPLGRMPTAHTRTVAERLGAAVERIAEGLGPQAT